MSYLKKLFNSNKADIVWFIKARQIKEYPNGLKGVRITMDKIYLGPFKTYDEAEEEREKFLLKNEVKMTQDSSYYDVKICSMYYNYTLV